MSKLTIKSKFNKVKANILLSYEFWNKSKTKQIKLFQNGGEYNKKQFNTT